MIARPPEALDGGGDGGSGVGSDGGGDGSAGDGFGDGAAAAKTTRGKPIH